MPIDWDDIRKIQPWRFTRTLRSEAQRQVKDHGVFANGVLFIRCDASTQWLCAQQHYKSWMKWATDADFWKCELVQKILERHPTVRAWMASVAADVSSGSLKSMSEAVHLWIIHAILPNASGRIEMVGLQGALGLLLREGYGAGSIGKTYPGTWDICTRSVKDTVWQSARPDPRVVLDSIKRDISDTKKRGHDQISKDGHDDDNRDSDVLPKTTKRRAVTKRLSCSGSRTKGSRYRARRIITDSDDEPSIPGNDSVAKDDKAGGGHQLCSIDEEFEEFNNPLGYTGTEHEGSRAPDHDEEFNNPAGYKDGLAM